MYFGFFGRYFGFSEPDGDPEDSALGTVLRRIAYGVAGTMLALLLILTLLVLAGRRPPPQRLAEARRTPAAATPGSAAPGLATVPSAAIDDAGDDPDEPLQALRRQVEQEATEVASLRDQADEVRRDLADIQRQQADAEAAHQGSVRTAGPPSQPAVEKPPSRLAVEKPAAVVPPPTPPAPVAAPAPPAQTAVAVAPEAPPRLGPRPEPPRKPATRELDRALERLRSGATPPAAAEAAPPLRTPPPTVLGQIQVRPTETQLATASPPVTLPPAAAAAVPARRRVFLHYRTGSQPGEDEANDLARRLLFSDFAYAETRTVPASSQAPLIRYFRHEDADSAARLADLLRGSGLDFRLQDATGAATRAAPGTLEVWIP